MSQLIIFHGTNQVTSRRALDEEADKWRASGSTVVSWDAEEDDMLQLEQVLGSLMLFVENKAVILKNIFSVRSNTQKEHIIQQILQRSEDTQPIIIWEKKKLTPLQLKKFPHAQSKHFPLSSSLFAWLESIGQQPKRNVMQLLRESLQQDEPEMCFHLLFRQLRLLIQMKTGKSTKLAPFMLTKLQSQAKKFSLEQLIAMHEELCFIDFNNRTGRYSRSLSRSIEQCILHW